MIWKVYGPGGKGYAPDRPALVLALVHEYQLCLEKYFHSKYPKQVKSTGLSFTY